MRATDSATELWTLLSQVMMARRGHTLAIAAELGLSPPQMWALRHLESETPLPMSTLAGLLHCDNSNVTGIVDRLEARGLVERRPAAHDRRVKHLHLTAAGTELRGQVGERMAETPEAFARLDASEQQQLVALLRKIAM
ncbi:MAG: MarR family transcriptional regulator [Solirubrobacterales bacterium]|nr:MarR family transcriptional regulator [Solirubrobacterales bacterium]